MSEELSRELFNHLVELAALQLDEQEAEYIRSQLNQQLKAIHVLEAIPVGDDVEPSAHGVLFPAEISPEPREDEWLPYPDPDALLAQAPAVTNRYIDVPDIPHTTLS
jgi:aspartyl/glutamyl-tRNA(Asn/Gln) amidotransferase C subunit